jgi:hypothetical protein
MESTINSSSSTTTTGSSPIGVDPVVALSSFVNESGGISSLINMKTIVNFLDSLWSIYAIIAYVLSICMLVLYVYASTYKRQLELLQLDTVKEQERIYDEQFRTGPKNNRLEDILKHITSDNPNDWKLSIIEADIMLDDALKQAGYGGVSLGDRLKSISPTQLNSLDEAWKAHKVRNQIAHAGADFILTHRTAEDTIKRYRQVLKELGVS